MTDSQFAARRVGILGGTFNPIHNGHVAMAQAALTLASLDRVFFMVDRAPPHKRLDMDVSAGQRLSMARLAAKPLDQRIAASGLELKRPGKSYTYETLRALRTQEPETQYHWIIGTDMLYDLPTWKNAREVMNNVIFLCIPRQDLAGGEREAAKRLVDEYNAQVLILPADVPPISSTDVRQRVLAGRPVNTLVPSAVEMYIYENALYFPEELRLMQEKLKAALNIDRYRHTMGVVREAAILAERFGIDPSEARLSALLHDCGRGADSGSLSHAKTSARLAREEYGVHNPAVLTAIETHTTGGVNMSKLAMALYLADMIEPGRAYHGVEELRDLGRTDLRRAVCLGLRQTMGYVKERGQALDPVSLAALNDLEQ